MLAIAKPTPAAGPSPLTVSSTISASSTAAATTGHSRRSSTTNAARVSPAGGKKVPPRPSAPNQLNAAWDPAA